MCRQMGCTPVNSQSVLIWLRSVVPTVWDQETAETPTYPEQALMLHLALEHITLGQQIVVVITPLY